MPRILNLNNYVATTNPHEASLKIVMQELPDGSIPAPLYFIGKRSKRYAVNIDTLESAKWNPRIMIDIDGTPAEYKEIVDWWFNNAQDDSDYKQTLAESFESLKDPVKHIKNAHHWLKTEAAYFVNGVGKYTKRKKEIGKYLENWLRRQLERQYM